MARSAQLVADTIKAAGGQTRVARHFDINQQSVFGWIQRGKVPGHRVRPLIRLAAANGYRVRESDLNAEVFC